MTGGHCSDAACLAARASGSLTSWLHARVTALGEVLRAHVPAPCPHPELRVPSVPPSSARANSEPAFSRKGETGPLHGVGRHVRFGRAGCGVLQQLWLFVQGTLSAKFVQSSCLEQVGVRGIPSWLPSLAACLAAALDPSRPDSNPWNGPGVSSCHGAAHGAGRTRCLIPQMAALGCQPHLHPRKLRLPLNFQKVL